MNIPSLSTSKLKQERFSPWIFWAGGETGLPGIGVHGPMAAAGAGGGMEGVVYPEDDGPGTDGAASNAALLVVAAPAGFVAAAFGTGAELI